ncbi:hypothetical protein MNBD_DELTA03-456 [hydrothermal vent metagenome]|uniref:Sulfate transporter, CysZ-type n=1 Tax=hydrothermal vent metagenome TaxID=652676 RepID=A0A3B0UP25_9ZZZZ
MTTKEKISLKHNPLTRLSKGFFYPFNSLGFIRRHRELYKYVILPFLINVLTFVGVIYWGFDFFQQQVMSRLPQGDAWYWLILNYFIIIAAVLVVLVLIFFTFSVLGALIASPFNDQLSERTEKLLTGGEERPFTWRGFWQDTIRTLIAETKKVIVFLLGMMLLLLLHLMPLLGTALYPVLSIAWTALFLILEYNGYVFARRGMTFADQRRVIFRHSALMSGFGLGMLCLLAIPFLQFLAIPLGVVGAVRILEEAGELGVGEPGTELKQ